MAENCSDLEALLDAIEEPRQEETKACRVCGETIQISAKKCIKCGSWLNWRRYFDLMSGTILALLTALFAVAANTFPILQKAFEWKDAIFMSSLVSMVGGKDPHVTFLESNEGHQMGVFHSGILEYHIQPPGKPASVVFLPLQIKGKEYEAFNPGDSRVITMSIDGANIHVIATTAAQLDRNLAPDAQSTYKSDACFFDLNYASRRSSDNSSAVALDDCEYAFGMLKLGWKQFRGVHLKKDDAPEPAGQSQIIVDHIR